MRDTSRRLQRTKEAIVSALFLLLENNAYEDITIQEISDSCDITRRTIYRHFKTKDEMLFFSFETYAKKMSDYFMKHQPKGFRGLCRLYFSFWEENIEYLIRLRDAEILYKLGNAFESLVHIIAANMNSTQLPPNVSYEQYLEKYKYHFGYRVAGFWHVTEIWCNETPRKSPDEMAAIMVDISGDK